jgi:hypothetical protein
MSEDEWDEEDEYCDETDEFTPEDCPMGSFSPGTEQCDFCEWYDVCAEAFEKQLKEARRL